MKTLYHVYYNTSGNSGLYLNPIIDSLSTLYNQKAFVNNYYPLEKKEYNRIFFKLTEKNEHNSHSLVMKFSFFRKIIRFLELKIGNWKLFGEIKENKPEIINYSLTNMPDAYSVLIKIKKISPKTIIIVTCHDVVPFGATKSIAYNDIYNISDYLLIHNENSRTILETNFGIPKKKILFHPFPLINLELLKGSHINATERTVPVFTFIGVMREEKGVQYLIDAWERLGDSFNGYLNIAGYKPDDVRLDYTKISNYKNVHIIIKSLSDEEYVDIIDSSDYIIFPYIKVGNSGVLSTVISMNKVPLTTKLPTFEESQYVFKENMCEPENIEELKKLLEKVSLNHATSFHEMQNTILNIRNENNRIFSNEVRNAYKSI